MARVERDFVRYRRRGDGKALARVFDELAPKLLLLAMHVVRDRDRAEDLVQECFLRVMAIPDRYDASRPLLPWMAGILQNEASKLRRREARIPDASRVPSCQDQDPATQAESRERDRLLHERIAGLPGTYPEVLILQLVHGLGPLEIARALGRPPATVHTQLRRGIRLLRSALPSGFALAGIVLSPGRGLAAVRAAVLSQIPSAVPATVLGGTLLMKKTILGTLVSVTVLAGLWLWLPTRIPDVPGKTETGVLAADRTNTNVEVEAQDKGAALAVEREELDPGLADPQTSLDVRLLFSSDGSPAEDVGVYLRRMNAPLGQEMRTADAGEILFENLQPGLYTVSVDRGSSSSVEVDVGRNAIALEIPKGVQVFGEVVDLTGKRISGARVYTPNEQHEDLFQLVARTGKDGRFTIRDLSKSVDLVVARAEGYQPSSFNSKGSGVVKARVGDAWNMAIVLGAYGQRLRGRVVDSTGLPVPHAWVCIAADETARDQIEGVPRPSVFGREAFFVRADRDGLFSTTEVPTGSVLLVASTPDLGNPHIGHGLVDVETGTTTEITLVLGPGLILAGTVRDTQGRPYAGCVIYAVWDGDSELGSFRRDLGQFISARRIISGADGSFQIRGLLPGVYIVTVGGTLDPWSHRTMRGSRSWQRKTLALAQEGTTQWNPVVDRRTDVALRIVGPDGEPVPGWFVEVRAKGTDSVLSAPTDAQGLTEVRDVVEAPLQLSVYRAKGNGKSNLPVRVLENVSPTDDEMEIRLTANSLAVASLRGRMVDEQGTPLTFSRIEVYRDPVVGTGPSDYDTAESRPSPGTFALDGIPPGTYWIRTRIPDYYQGLFGPYHIAPGRIMDLRDLILPTPGGLEVLLRQENGEPLEFAEVDLLASPAQRFPMTRLRGSESRYTAPPLPPGSWWLRVRSDSTAPVHQEVRILPGQSRVLELTCSEGQQVRLQVQFAEDPDLFRRGPRNARAYFDVVDKSGRRIISGFRDDKPFLNPRSYLAEFTFQLLPGEYTIHARDEMGGLHDGKAVETTITVPPSGAVEPVRMRIK